MKNTPILAFLGILLLASTSYADSSDYTVDEEQAGEVDAYNSGWTAACDFCVDLTIPAPPSPVLGSFNDACQAGFADYVHGDATCVQNLNKWQWAKFWEAIIQVCNQNSPWDQ